MGAHGDQADVSPLRPVLDSGDLAGYEVTLKQDFLRASPSRDQVVSESPGSAYVAAESARAPLIYEGFMALGRTATLTTCCRKMAPRFSHQLKLLVPMLEFMVGDVYLPPHVRGELNRLRALRNRIANTGSCATLSQQDAGKLLVAGIFGIRYAEGLLTAIRTAPNASRLPSAGK